jgi:hypothetical protein
MDAMKSIAAATMLLMLVTGAAEAGQRGEREARSCRIEVLHSEEIPIGPQFYHTVKAHLLVTAPGASPFETTVIKVIPWQVPPPRRGQRVRVRCDPALLNPSWF